MNQFNQSVEESENWKKCFISKILLNIGQSPKMEAAASCIISNELSHHLMINRYICFYRCNRCYSLESTYFTYVKNIVVCVFIC